MRNKLEDWGENGKTILGIFLIIFLSTILLALLLLPSFLAIPQDLTIGIGTSTPFSLLEVGKLLGVNEVIKKNNDSYLNK